MGRPIGFITGPTLLGLDSGADLMTELSSVDPELFELSSVDPDGCLLIDGLGRLLAEVLETVGRLATEGLDLVLPLRFVGRFAPLVGRTQLPLFPLILCFIQSRPLFTTLTATCLVTLFTLFAMVSNILEQGCPREAEGLGFDFTEEIAGLGLVFAIEAFGLPPFLVTAVLGLVFAIEAFGLPPFLVTAGLGLVFAIETFGLPPFLVTVGLVFTDKTAGFCGLGFSFTKATCFLLIEPIFVLIPGLAFGLIFDPVFFLPLQKLLSPFFKH
jgi:hypothetical protein